MRIRRVPAFALAAGLCLAQPAMQAPAGSAPLAEIHGTIERVQITPGAGMPYISVGDGKSIKRVYLGSIRYLIEQNFNPKAGQTVTVKAYRFEDSYLAATVEIAGEKVLRLRDESGRPVWRGRRFRQLQPE